MRQSYFNALRAIIVRHVRTEKAALLKFDLETHPKSMFRWKPCLTQPFVYVEGVFGLDHYDEAVRMKWPHECGLVGICAK